MKIFLYLLLFGLPVLALKFDPLGFISSKAPFRPPEQSAPTPPKSECILVQVHELSRHGTRGPTRGDWESLNKLVTYAHSLQELPEHLEWMKVYQNPFLEEQVGLLNEIGVKDLKSQAKRAHRRYGEYLENAVNRLDIKVLATKVKRTQQSASAYLEELFGPDHENRWGPGYQMLIEVLQGDDAQLLRPWESCPKWTYDVITNNAGKRLQSEIKTVTYSKLEKRLKEIVSDSFPENLVETVYSACQLEVGELEITNQWCSLLDVKDFVRFELLSDISAYFKHGPGESLSKVIPCRLWSYIIDNMETKLNNLNASETKNFYFMFAHAETVLIFSAFLGLYDIDMTNFTRKLVQSRDIPFAANIYIELYLCDPGKPMVRLLVNERPRPIPGCSGNQDQDGTFLCPLDTFKSIHQAFYGCELQQYCPLKPNETIPEKATKEREDE